MKRILTVTKMYMRKFLIISCLLLLAAPFVQAQDWDARRWSVDVSAAYPGNLVWTGVGEGVAEGIGQVFAVIFTFGLYKPEKEYERSEDATLPAFAIQGGYQVLPWLQVTGDLYYHNAGKKYFVKAEDLVPGKISSANRIALLPGVKFTYLNKGVFHMYSSVALGPAVRFSEATVRKTDNETGEVTTETTSSTAMRFAFQATTLGFAFGNAFYGFLDMGIGTEYTGLRAGLGYKF